MKRIILSIVLLSLMSCKKETMPITKSMTPHGFLATTTFADSLIKVSIPDGYHPTFVESLLFASNGTLLDGNLTQYDTSFCNCLDNLDARKMMNPGPNLGIARYGYILAVERRKTFTESDTISQWMNHLSLSYGYYMSVITQGFSANIAGYVDDTFLHLQTPLAINDTTKVFFSIDNDPLSYDTTRLRVILFKKVPLRPVFNKQYLMGDSIFPYPSGDSGRLVHFKWER